MNRLKTLGFIAAATLAPAPKPAPAAPAPAAARPAAQDNGFFAKLGRFIFGTK